MQNTIDELGRQLERLRLAHQMTCQSYAELLGAAWAAVGAAETGAPDPLWRLRDELTAHPMTTPRGAGELAASSPTTASYGPVAAPALAPGRAA